MEGSKNLSVETTPCSAESKYYLHPAQAVLTLNAKWLNLRCLHFKAATPIFDGNHRPNSFIVFLKNDWRVYSTRPTDLILIFVEIAFLTSLHKYHPIKNSPDLREAGLVHNLDLIFLAILSRILFVFRYLIFFVRKINKGSKQLK